MWLTLRSYTSNALFYTWLFVRGSSLKDSFYFIFFNPQRIKKAVAPTLDLDAMDPHPKKQKADKPVLEKLLRSSV